MPPTPRAGGRARLARACAFPGTLAVLLLAIGVGTARARTTVTLTAEDGVSLSATVWEPDGRAVAGIVLVHGPARSRHDWDWLAGDLAARGFLAVAVDLRGHGGSAGVDAGGDLVSMVRDVTAAARYLLERPDGPSSLGLVGASLGGTLGVLAAQAVPALRSFTLLSTPLDFRGLRVEDALRKLPDRAVLVVASNEDVYAARSARALADTGPGRRELVLVEGAGHGARILVSRPDLRPTLVDWFVRTLL
jgi:pimeloyl-ACP methyl ester carboxylesterase